MERFGLSVAGIDIIKWRGMVDCQRYQCRWRTDLSSAVSHWENKAQYLFIYLYTYPRVQRFAAIRPIQVRRRKARARAKIHLQHNIHTCIHISYCFEHQMTSSILRMETYAQVLVPCC